MSEPQYEMNYLQDHVRMVREDPRSDYNSECDACRAALKAGLWRIVTETRPR